MIGPNTAKIVDAHRAIPEEKRKEKTRNTLVGLAAVAASVAFEVFKFRFPWWFNAGLFVFGGFCISQDYVKGFFGFIPAAIKDIREALKG